MPTIQELNAKVTELQETIDTEQSQIQSALDKLNETVTDLTAQLADGGTETDRQAVLDKLNSAIADLEGTISDGTTDPE